MTILVTGGAGYIGSHMTYELLDRGEAVVVLDNLVTGIRSLVSERVEFVEGDVSDRQLVRTLISRRGVNAVIHFAGSTIVPESVAEPMRYYANNMAASLALIEACTAEGVQNFIFSSTAAVYGPTSGEPVRECHALMPMSPYGRSKLMTEWIVQDAARAAGFGYAILRYFNVAGADLAGRTGQSTPNATHLIKRVCRTALGRLPHLDVYGTDFDTPDGTGVRDYVHVADLVTAHRLALEALRAGAPSGIYNCGYGRGFSVREVIRVAEKITGTRIRVEEKQRRPGDAASVISDPTKLKHELGWHPINDDLSAIVRSALDWESRFNS